METIEGLKEKIKERQARLEELKLQDETGWSEFDKSIKGKEINMYLVRNHIKYYAKQLKELERNSLTSFFK